MGKTLQNENNYSILLIGFSSSFSIHKTMKALRLKITHK